MSTADPSRFARFAAAYARNPNGKQAALVAGYAPRSAADSAVRLLRRADVGAALAGHREDHFAEVEEMAERLLAATMAAAFADSRRLLDANGRLKPIGEIDDGVLDGFNIFDPRPPFGRGRVRRVRRSGKLAALKFLALYLRLLDAPACGAGLPDAATGGFGRRARFAAQYTVDFNGYRAAVRAGYPACRAAVEACGLLKLPEIAGAIAERTRQRFARVGLGPERVLAEIGRVAFTSPRPLLEVGGQGKTLAEMDDDTVAALDWIDFDRDGRTVLGTRSLDKLFALELLARHYGLIIRDS